MSSPLRVAGGHNLAYAPQYVALEQGFFSDRGLEVSMVHHPVGFSDVVTTLRDGRADVVLGSVLFALRLAEESDTSPVLVAEPNQQTRHFLMARPGHPQGTGAFDWSRLRGRSVLVYPNPVPTPWVAFREVLRLQGLGLDDVMPIVGFTPQAAVAEFLRGVGDFLLVDHESAGDCGLVELASLADALGPVPWSVYCASRDVANRRAEDLERFRAGLAAGVAWLHQHSAPEAAALLHPSFPDVEPRTIGWLVDRYQQIELWRPDPRVDPEHLSRWQAALLRAGLVGPQVDLHGMLVQH